MFHLNRRMRRTGSVLFAIALLTLSLLLVACGSRFQNVSGQSSSTGTSQQTTTTTTTTAADTATPQTSSPSGNTSQQLQDAIQAIDNALNDVSSADATAAVESGADEQP